MNKSERIKMVKAMEYIARQVNDEDIFVNLWLPVGVADGDIEYGDLTTENEDTEYYIEDETFSELMGVFLQTMKKAYQSGGLYCDGVTDDLEK